MRNAFKILLTAWVAIIILLSGNCHKEKGEELLSITTDASAVNTSIAADFGFKLIIKSAMPKNGVLIEYTVKGESDNNVYYQREVITSQKENQLQILNLPRQLMCICNIVVTSKSMSTNVATANFRVGYK